MNYNTIRATLVEMILSRVNHPLEVSLTLDQNPYF